MKDPRHEGTACLQVSSHLYKLIFTTFKQSSCALAVAAAAAPPTAIATTAQPTACGNLCV